MLHDFGPIDDAHHMDGRDIVGDVCIRKESRSMIAVAINIRKERRSMIAVAINDRRRRGNCV